MGGPPDDLWKKLVAGPLGGKAFPNGLDGVKKHPYGLIPPPPGYDSLPPAVLVPPAPPPSPAPPAKPSQAVELSLGWARVMTRSLLKRKAQVSLARVLPGVDALAILEGKRVRAAFVYSDLHVFTKLVATQPENESFVFLDTFIQMATRYTKQFNGQVVDCAGDRVLSVFFRPLGDLSHDPVENAVTFALWLQKVFHEVIAPAFTGRFGELSVGIGIDYGVAVAGCVGIRDQKRIVFFGDAANNAAKLQEDAGEGETILSSEADSRRPSYLDHESWGSRRERRSNGEVVLKINGWFADDHPPRPK